MNSKAILKILRQHKTFLISTHVNPDADALCSELVLALFLKSLGKKVLIVNEDKMPSMYQAIPRKELIQKMNSPAIDYDVAIVVDCGDLARIGNVKKVIQNDRPIVNIDHHITNDFFGQFNLIQDKASSTAEVIYGLVKEAGFRLTKDIAILLYLGIMTDTGSFRYDNTSSQTHAVVSDLLKFGFSVSQWYRTIYENISSKDFEMFNQVLRDVELVQDDRVASLVLRKKTVQWFSKDFDLRDKIFSSIRSIKEVQVVAIYTEVNKHETRVNFRSKGKMNVARLAARYGGGGHRRASGCWLREGFRTVKRKISKELRKLLK